MRRTVCIGLILMFWLGPLAAILPANAESRVPACCRRHGAHACVMSAAMASMVAKASSVSVPVLTTPARCSSYPGLMAASTEPLRALAVSPAELPIQLVEIYSPASIRTATRLSVLRTHANRGPPLSDIG